MADLKDWVDALGIGGIIILGLVLFFFPEPITSFMGIVIIILACLAWLAGWYRTRNSEAQNTTTQ